MATFEINFRTLIKYHKEFKFIWTQVDNTKFNHTSRVGNLVNIYNTCKPFNVKYFGEYYMNKYPTQWNTFVYNIEKWARAKFGVNAEQAYYIAYITLIYNTYVGGGAEEHMANVIMSTGYKLWKTNPQFDTKYAVDFIGIDTMEFRYGFQIKSVNSTKDNKSNYIKRNKRKNREFLKSHPHYMGVIWLYYSYEFDCKSLTCNYKFEPQFSHLRSYTPRKNK